MSFASNYLFGELSKSIGHAKRISNENIGHNQSCKIETQYTCEISDKKKFIK